MLDYAVMIGFPRLTFLPNRFISRYNSLVNDFWIKFLQSCCHRSCAITKCLDEMIRRVNQINKGFSQWKEE
jgi:hypothetical protein